MNDLIISREAAAHRGRRREYFTIAWNSLECLIGIGAGMVAGSVSQMPRGNISMSRAEDAVRCKRCLHTSRLRGTNPIRATVKLRCKASIAFGLAQGLVEVLLRLPRSTARIKLLRLAEPPRLRQSCETEPQRDRRHLVRRTSLCSPSYLPSCAACGQTSRLRTPRLRQRMCLG
jgi:hypothetical protein